MRLRSIFVTAAVAAFTLAGTAVAQDTADPHCGDFVVFVVNDDVTVVDLGPEGASVGDQRVIRGRLLNDEGDQIGTQHAIATLSHSSYDGQELLYVSLLETFDNGSVASTAMIPSPDASDANSRPDASYQRAVTGGTGDFAEVTGSATLQTREDGARQVSYELSCDD